MKTGRFSIVSRAELAVLLLLTAVFIFPLGITQWSNAELLVDIYRFASVTTIALSHILYLLPARETKIDNVPIYAVGTLVVILIASLWIIEPDMGRIDFSELSEGGMLAPIVFSFTVVITQLIVNNISVSRKGA